MTPHHDERCRRHGDLLVVHRTERNTGKPIRICPICVGLLAAKFRLETSRFRNRLKQRAKP